MPRSVVPSARLPIVAAVNRDATGRQMGHFGGPQRRPGRADPEAMRKAPGRARGEAWRSGVVTERIRLDVGRWDTGDRRGSGKYTRSTRVVATGDMLLGMRNRRRRARALLGTAFFYMATLGPGKRGRKAHARERMETVGGARNSNCLLFDVAHLTGPGGLSKIYRGNVVLQPTPSHQSSIRFQFHDLPLISLNRTKRRRYHHEQVPWWHWGATAPVCALLEHAHVLPAASTPLSSANLTRRLW